MRRRALLAVLAAAVSLLARFRRSKGQQRQQLKWLAYGGAFLAAILVADLVSLDPPGLWDMVLETLSFGALYLGVGMAVLRHRLYDIDRLINRTLTYGLLTALLAAVYTAGVFLLGRLLDPATGDSALAVAAATLAVAALFQPLRRRVQAVVDRRFNRARYDAARTVEAFSARLRDQLDLDSLAAELVAVVDETVQPTSASLWLRPSYRKLPRRDGALQRPRLSRTDLVAAPGPGHARAMTELRPPAAPPRRRPRLDPAPPGRARLGFGTPVLWYGFLVPSAGLVLALVTRRGAAALAVGVPAAGAIWLWIPLAAWLPIF